MGNAKHASFSPRHCAHQNRTTGEEVDIAAKLTRFVDDDHSIVVHRVVNLDLARFHDDQVDVGLTSPKYGLAVRVIAGGCQRLDERDFGAGQMRKCHVLNRSCLNLDHGFLSAIGVGAEDS